MKFVKLTLISCAMIGLLTACCWAAVDQDEMVPNNATSAKTVINKLQKSGTTNIRSVEYDDNQWNVKTQHGQKETNYAVNPNTGNVTSKEVESEYETAPPSNVLGIMEVINTVERQGLNGIREIEYDDSLWKVEVVQDGKVTKLCLDPIAGDVIWQDSQPAKVLNNKSTYQATKPQSTPSNTYKNGSSQSTYRNSQPQGSSNSSSTNSSSQPWQQNQNQSGSSQSGSSTSGSNYQPW